MSLKQAITFIVFLTELFFIYFSKEQVEVGIYR